MAYMTKRNGKWQAQVKMKGIRRSKSFTKKALASQWANKVEVEIINGTYQDNNELVKMSVGELVDLFFDHTRLNTAHESRLRDECNKLKRYPIAKTFYPVFLYILISLNVLIPFPFRRFR